MLYLLISVLSSIQIISGTVVSEYEPRIASIQKTNVFNCGASVVGEQWVLTAAHCVEQSDFTYRIGIGSNNLEGQRSVDVEKIFIHPEHTLGFRPISDNRFDLALLKTKDKAFKEFFEIDQPGEPGEWGVAFGWGVTESGYLSFELQKAELPITPFAMCDIMYNGIDESYFCVGQIYDSRNTCFGDSGGPYVQNDKLVGVISWGNVYCDTALHYAGMSKIDIQWVEKIIRENSDREIYIPLIKVTRVN